MDTLTIPAQIADLRNVRNIGIMAHIDAGKTTVAERILYYTGRTHRMGDVDDGTTVMDWMDQERERGITIVSAATTTSWRGHRITLIDTPGHVDFGAEVERSLRVLDGAIVLFCGVGGVQPQSEAVWRQADKYGVPAVAFVNKMDRVGADYWRVVEEIGRRLGVTPLPVVVPLVEDRRLVATVDVIEGKASYYNEDDLGATYRQEAVPEQWQAQLGHWREHLIQLASEWDDALFHQYCTDQTISPAELRAALRKATLSRRAVTVLCGAALRNHGIQRLLDAVVDYLPSPADLPPLTGFRKGGEAVQRTHRPEESLTALAFKVVTDRHVGKMVYLRVYSGHIRVGTYVYNATKRRRQRISRLMQMHADRPEERDVLGCGEIGVAIGLSDTTTGDTLCAEADPILLEPIEFAVPVVSQSIVPRSTAEKDRLASALARLADEDPTFTIAHNAETDELVISGMGELHLDVFVERLRREFGVSPNVGTPKVAYRETITRPAEVNHKHVKQTGGHGQYAHVVLRLEPLEPGRGFEFHDEVRGGRVPAEYIPAVERGVRKVVAEGVHPGVPVVDVAVRLLDGSFHEVDSSEMAFRTCAWQAFREAFLLGGPQLLEPVSSVNVAVHEEFSGAVIGSICTRRGRVLGIDHGPARHAHVIRCMVPLAEMFGYATDLRSITSGRGQFDMRFERYEPVPAELAEEIARSRRESA